jgi:crossover junction endodeoxyribonuclease RuvC
MVLFGIDPGSAITGYGIIRTRGNETRWVDSGVIKTRPRDDLAHKLGTIYDKLSALMATHEPDWVCVEEAFYAKNARTALVLGHARGVALLAGSRCGASVAEYSARSIKQAVVGKGGATKEQISFMVKTLLSPPGDHDQTDACDALAAALCGFSCIRAGEVLGRR